MSNTTAAEPTVTITKAEYDRLLKREAWLDALESMGVDNWQGYGEAYPAYEEALKAMGFDPDN